jgi:hypothetical protein
MKKNQEIEVSVAEVVDYLKLKGIFARALREVVQRKVTVSAAKEKGLSVSDVELQKVADAFRITNQLHDAKDTTEWLNSIGVSVEYLEGYLETNVLVKKFKDTLEKEIHIKDLLSNEEIKDDIRRIIYNDWLKQQIYE